MTCPSDAISVARGWMYSLKAFSSPEETTATTGFIAARAAAHVVEQTFERRVVHVSREQEAHVAVAEPRRHRMAIDGVRRRGRARAAVAMFEVQLGRPLGCAEETQRGQRGVAVRRLLLDR